MPDAADTDTDTVSGNQRVYRGFIFSYFHFSATAGGVVQFLDIYFFTVGRNTHHCKQVFELDILLFMDCLWKEGRKEGK